jgi:hypothetical protein
MEKDVGRNGFQVVFALMIVVSWPSCSHHSFAIYELYLGMSGRFQLLRGSQVH